MPMMAVFGAPVAHGNDPERALRTAVAIHAAMPALGDEIGQPVSVHAGIASGSIVFSGMSGEGENAATVGEAVNLAARLAGLSVAGETVVSEAVYRANPDIIVGEAMGEVALKGVDAPVKAWRVDGLADPSAGRDARPFVGREAERRQFAGIAAACEESGHGQTIYVRGEAGIGKSRLVDEFQASAGDLGYACHSGLVLDFGAGRDEDAARTVTRSLLGLAATDDEGKRQAAADKCVSDGLAAPERRVHLNELLGMTQPADVRAMYDAMDGAARERGRRELIGELVSNASARQPVLIRIEDIHWADPGLLGDLYRVEPCHRIAVVADGRDFTFLASYHTRLLRTRTRTAPPRRSRIAFRRVSRPPAAARRCATTFPSAYWEKVPQGTRCRPALCGYFGSGSGHVHTNVPMVGPDTLPRIISDTAIFSLRNGFRAPLTYSPVGSAKARSESPGAKP